jgi:hypothetical protein
VSGGIRINELRLAGSSTSQRSYGASFRSQPGGSFLPLSVIAGPTQTGKSSIADFIKYCLGADEYPQHPEVIAAVRAALVEIEMAGQLVTIERAATGPVSKFASVWESRLGELDESTERRISADHPSDPDGLSQFVLAACDLNGIELPEAPTKVDSPTALLSIRDVFRVMFVPNDRLDNKNLVFEQSNFMVRQKFLQTIDVMFGVHDSEGATLGARQRAARDAVRAAAQSANSMRRIAEADYPRGPIHLRADLDAADLAILHLGTELKNLDRRQRSTEQASRGLRRVLEEGQKKARGARVRVRDRRSLLDRLAALRGQYADDKRKLNFLKDAERLFDPLQVVVCPACLNALDESPSLDHGHCSLCGHLITSQPIEEPLQAPDAAPDIVQGPIEDHTSDSAGANEMEPHGSDANRAKPDRPTDPLEDATNDSAVLEAELRAVSRRLDSLNDYWERLHAHLNALVEESIRADEMADAAAAAVDQITQSPAPWLALRDDLTRRITQARLTTQHARAGLNMWQRVDDADSNRERLELEARRIAALRREAKARPDRSAVVSALSRRFGAILEDIEYPKLARPYLDDDLVPHVRDLPYTAASSGGLVLISLAWHLAIWEVAFEQDAAAPGLLVLDSPQKNLGHGANPSDPDFADTRLVTNFYEHVRRWLASAGMGAQLIVIDNTPPDTVREEVVVRFTRDPEIAPYGLITNAVD